MNDQALTNDRAYQVLIGVDYSAVSSGALLEALKLARTHERSQIHVLHAVPSTLERRSAAMVPSRVPLATVPPELPDEEPEVTPDVARELQEFVETTLAGARGTTSEPGKVSWSTHVRVAEPAEAIVNLATELRTDLVVLGTHGRSGLERLLLGSVAEAVVRRAPCPILVVPPLRTGYDEPASAAVAKRDAEA
jgi:nucleotide-binding universal stress UspA family protein